MPLPDDDVPAFSTVQGDDVDNVTLATQIRQRYAVRHRQPLGRQATVLLLNELPVPLPIASEQEETMAGCELARRIARGSEIEIPITIQISHGRSPTASPGPASASGLSTPLMRLSSPTPISQVHVRAIGLVPPAEVPQMQHCFQLLTDRSGRRDHGLFTVKGIQCGITISQTLAGRYSFLAGLGLGEISEVHRAFRCITRFHAPRAYSMCRTGGR